MHAVICVTDDELAIRSPIMKRLNRQGHHVVVYGSGEALVHHQASGGETARPHSLLTGSRVKETCEQLRWLLQEGTLVFHGLLV